MCVQWFSCSFGYYQIEFQVKYLTGDLYINNISQASSECLAYLVSNVFLSMFGVRAAFIISYIVGLVGMAALLSY